MLSLQFSPFPVLQTRRLTLNQIFPADAPALFALRSHPDVMKYLERPLAKSEEEALALINTMTELLQKGEAVSWGIYPNDGSTLMGTIGFWRIQPENYRAEIGYLLHPSLQGKGMMQEAMQAALRYGFQTMKLHSVEAQVNPSNQASIKLLERNGFVREAYFRENFFFGGRFLDTAVYSLLATNPVSA